MHQRARVLRAALGALALLHAAAAASAQQPPVSAAGDVGHGRITFTSPPFAVPSGLRDTLRFGWLTVPRDHDDPAAGTFRIAVGVIAARTPAPASDPIVVIPGGPGSAQVQPSSVAMARSPRLGLHRRTRAVVVLDPRGHGLSEPRTCPELDGAEPLSESDTLAERRLLRALAECRQRMLAAGDDPRLLSSVQVARDLELLRGALGASQLNLVGGSYGSRIAAEALRTVPGSIRAVLLDGPVPASAPRSGPGQVSDSVLAVLFRRCAADRACRRAYPQLAADYATIMARTGRSPLVLRMRRSARAPEEHVVLDSAALHAAFAEVGYSRELIAAAPLLIHTLAGRGVRPLERLAPGLLREIDSRDKSLGTQLAFRCNDGSIRRAEMTLRARCLAWIGRTPAEWESSASVRSDIPALLTTGEFDPRTPPTNVLDAAEGLTRAHLGIIPWYGHAGLPDCAFRIADAFFASPLETPSMACLDSVPPVRFVRDVVPSDWFGSAAVTAASRPRALLAIVLAAGLLLLAAPALSARRVARTTARARGRLSVLAPSLTAAAGLALLLGAAAALRAGARMSMVVPGIGVPTAWRWVLLLPWLLAACTLVTILLGVRARRLEPGAIAAVAGAGLLLVAWITFAL